VGLPGTPCCRRCYVRGALEQDYDHAMTPEEEQAEVVALVRDVAALMEAAGR